MIDSPSIKLPIEFESSLDANHKLVSEVSVPLPKSMVVSVKQLSVTADTNDVPVIPNEIDALCQVVAYWPDNSIKWVKLTIERVKQTPVYLNINNTQTGTPESSNTQFVENTNATDNYSFKSDDKTLILHLAKHQLTMLDVNDNAMLNLNAGDLELADSQGQSLTAYFDSAIATQQPNLKNNDSPAVTLKIKGHFSGTLVRFQLMLDWLLPFDLVQFTLQIHNTNRAMHHGGKWDLGDTGSFFFKSFSINLNTTPKVDTSQTSKPKRHTFTDVQSNQSFNAESFFCEQFSSGGDNWQSLVHVNHKNHVEINRNGFVLQHGNTEYTGLRCQPVIGLQNNLAITLDQFWQNFPKSLSVAEQTVTLGLFPSTHYLHELQGGEKKTHSFWLSLNSAQNDLTSNHLNNRGHVAWDWVNQCDLYPFIEKEQPAPNSLQSIIDLGVNSASSFMAKRETLDEYGWRNFGELYADHETAGYQGDDIFVSHYNNQYDPIYGFLRQYLITGNTKWFELANDLATHVKDIDIYHTKLDKSEYNGGLFWHTDHYLQAFTSSHRSYSKHQASDAYQDHSGGGGPGGQHCYTTGLYLHYCLTGQQSSKDAVLTLTNWITHVYEGSGTCLELLLAFKNRHFAGYKNHFTGQYPLDRGIANYVNALLDSFELTQNEDYLTQVHNILSNAMHPDEDLTHRDLQNIENTWFYTVLLQALCRFLQVKQSRQEFDQHFYYCRDCLLNFADWMLVHEYPYLEKPDILEYPNDTWTAQDLRKAHVLAGAYYFSPHKKTEYLTKAQFFQQYVADKLTKADTKTYTRILVLLMQNQGAMEFFQKQPAPIAFAPRENWPAAKYQQTSVYGGLLKVFTKRLMKISPKAELDWLKKRLA
ncbi:MAG: hypothetical protein ABJK37_10865 [Paraglaciecola sp.]|uniref:hypothetical protein n=1 Tax=Paraglaciecola sp. TaxID=1920173 RepID=UPI00329A3BC9